MLDMFLKWDGFIFPKLVKIIYYIGLVVIGLGAVLGALGALFGGFAMGEGFGGFIGFVGILVGGALGLILWRVYMELLVVLFSIHDILKEMRDKGRMPGA